MTTSNTPHPLISHNLPIQWITVHCSATAANQNVDAARIRQWHLAKGWLDIGYHWVITRNGHIETGRPAEQIGAHVKGANQGNLGICLIGGCDAQQHPQDNFTLAQRKALFHLISQLQTQYGIDDDHIRPHHYWANKACPVINLHSTDFRHTR